MPWSGFGRPAAHRARGKVIDIAACASAGTRPRRVETFARCSIRILPSRGRVRCASDLVAEQVDIHSTLKPSGTLANNRITSASQESPLVKTYPLDTFIEVLKEELENTLAGRSKP